MFEQIAETARPFLNFPYVQRTRRNHGLEHATIHVLGGKQYRLSGRSDDGGFVLLGEVPTEAVEAAVSEALRRMRGGEHSLAVHPNCGTNLLTTGFLTSVVGIVGLGGRSRTDSFNRLPYVMLLMMAAVLYSQPLGMNLQKYFTTEGNPGDLEILSVKRSEVHLPWSSEPLTVHRVNTTSS